MKMGCGGAKVEITPGWGPEASDVGKVVRTAGGNLSCLSLGGEKRGGCTRSISLMGS